MRPRAFLGGEDHAAAMYELEASRQGRTVVESRITFCRIADGLLAEAWIHAFDLYGPDEFWT